MRNPPSHKRSEHKSVFDRLPGAESENAQGWQEKILLIVQGERKFDAILRENKLSAWVMWMFNLQNQYFSPVHGCHCCQQKFPFLFAKKKRAKKKRSEKWDFFLLWEIRNWKEQPIWISVLRYSWVDFLARQAFRPWRRAREKKNSIGRNTLTCPRRHCRWSLDISRTASPYRIGIYDNDVVEREEKLSFSCRPDCLTITDASRRNLISFTVERELIAVNFSSFEGH